MRQHHPHRSRICIAAAALLSALIVLALCSATFAASSIPDDLAYSDTPLPSHQANDDNITLAPSTSGKSIIILWVVQLHEIASHGVPPWNGFTLAWISGGKKTPRSTHHKQQ